jgi:tetratricopeptide (TPR) repeat protein
MSPGSRRASARPALRLVATIFVSLPLIASCASKPKAAIAPAFSSATASPVAQSATPVLPALQDLAPAQPAAQVEATVSGNAPVAGPAQAGGTALKTADPAELARGREDREAIETSIVFGSPSALARAKDLAAKPSALKADESAALAAIAAGVSALAYPEEPAAQQPKPAMEGLSALSIGLLQALSDASAGRFPAVPPEAAGTSLGELIPALVVFVSDSSDSSRRAFDALDRFARLGAPSIMPSLLRGVDAERRGDWQGALGLYRSALAIAPDAWSASLGSARALLAQKRFADALAALTPLAKGHAGLASFDRPFALALYAIGRYAEAEPYVARVLTRDPQDSRFILMRARLLVRSKAYPQALPLLDAYGTVDPSNRLYLLLRSLECEGLRTREEALKWARRGLAAYPDDPELLAAAARLLYAGPAFGREEARVLASRACELTAAGSVAATDSDAESSSSIQAARAAAGVEASRILALDSAARYKWSDAAASLERAGAAFEDKALAARILLKSGNARGSLDYAAAWRRSEPASEAATEAYLRALIATGDEKAAQEAIARLLPGTISAPYRSVLYFLQSKLQKSDEAALTLLRSALVENADNPEALAAVSDIQLRRKDLPKARFYLKQAIALDPDDPELEARQKKLDELTAP